MKYICIINTAFLLLTSCSSKVGSSSMDADNRLGGKTYLSVGLNDSGYSLMQAYDGYSAELSCVGSDSVVELNETNPTTVLFGDDISNCSLELLTVSAGGMNQTLDDNFKITPSKVVSLANYPAGDDINIEFKVDEIEENSDVVIASNFVTSNIGVTVSGSTAPTYSVDSVEVIAINATELGMRIGLSCSTCDEIELAIGSGATNDIDSQFLSELHRVSVLPIEGGTISTSGSVTYKLADLSLTYDSLDNVDLIFSMTYPNSDSYTYTKIQSEVESNHIECGTDGGVLWYNGGDLKDGSGDYCTKILGTLKISDTDLSDLDKLTNLKEIENLHVDGNDNLTSFNGLENLKKLDELYVYDNRDLLDISQLTNITSLKRLIIGSKY